MTCPSDGTMLVMADRFGVEIDYCPTCRGVWLDRGELDKIIERAAKDFGTVPLPETVPTRTPMPPPYGKTEVPSQYQNQRRDYDDDDDDYRKKRKKKSFLDDIFDF